MIRLFVLGLATTLAAAPANSAERIVSAGGDITETIFALGLGHRLVAADTTSRYPEAAAALPKIGYVRDISAEGVISMEPDLLIAAADAGPVEEMALLKDAGVAIAVAPETPRLEDVPDKVRFVGQALGVEAAAEVMAKGIADDLSSLTAVLAKTPEKPRVLLILAIRGGAPIVGGAKTAADLMIEAAGGVNVAASIDGWKPMNAEAIIAAAPDVVLTTDVHPASNSGIEEILGRPDISLTPAGAEGRGAVLEAMLVLGLGPRVADGVRAMARAIHTPLDLQKAGL